MSIILILYATDRRVEPAARPLRSYYQKCYICTHITTICHHICPHISTIWYKTHLSMHLHPNFLPSSVFLFAISFFLFFGRVHKTLYTLASFLYGTRHISWCTFSHLFFLEKAAALQKAWPFWLRFGWTKTAGKKRLFRCVCPSSGIRFWCPASQEEYM